MKNYRGCTYVFQAKAQNLLRIPEPYTEKLLNAILKRMYKRYKSDLEEALNDELLDIAEYTFTGMTLQELFDFLKYLANKANSNSAQKQVTKQLKSRSKL